jgi:superoxide dismutase, Cu-Zn family
MIKPATAAAVLFFSVPALAIAACSPRQPASTQTGTTPPVFNGSSSPSASASGQAPGTQRLTAQLNAANGTPVANATFDFANGYATVTVETIGNGILSPGFHGMHIHAVGKCEANSVAPTGGAPGDFNSAGGHYQAPGHTAHAASGDLTSVEVRGDGAAKLVTTTDAFTAADLLAGAKTAIIIHQDPDNFANIPPDRYQQVNGAPPPDEITLATGDAGKRVACGVING